MQIFRFLLFAGCVIGLGASAYDAGHIAGNGTGYETGYAAGQDDAASEPSRGMLDSYRRGVQDGYLAGYRDCKEKANGE